MSEDDGQSVIVEFEPGSIDDCLPQFFALGDALDEALSTAGVGEYDGNADETMYAYGPDAEAMWAVMEPLLRAFGRPCEVELRLGPEDDEDVPTRVLKLPG